MENSIKYKDFHRGIKTESILSILLVLFIITENIAQHTMYSRTFKLFFSLVSIIFILLRKKINYNSYFNIQIIFFVYHLILILTGNVISNQPAFDSLQTYLINFVVLMSLYNYITFYGNKEKYIDIYIYSSMVSLMSIFILLKGNIFEGRLGHSWENSVSYYFIGEAVYLSANSIGTFCSIAMLFSLFSYHNKNKNRYILLSIFFIIGVLLSGSRKSILLVSIFIVYFLIKSSRKNKIKLIISLYSIPILLVLSSIAIFKIPILYEIIGERLKDLILGILGYNVSEPSFLTRKGLLEVGKEMIYYRPIFGYGLGYFKHIVGISVDNNYFDLMISGGIVGTILYYMYMILVIRKYMLGRKKYIGEDTKMLLFIIFIFLFIDIGSVTFLSTNITSLITAFFAFFNIDRYCHKNKIHH